MKNKLLLGFASMAVVSLPVAAVVSCGGSTSNKPTFYNYEAYIAEEVQAQLEDTFSYSTFADLPDFESLIKTQKTVGGIGSDYLNAKLAKDGLIQKIDFTKVFPSLEGKNDAEIVEALKHIYTQETWELMASFDNYIGDNNHLYEYMIPYYIQNKVVAFDLDLTMKLNTEDQTPPADGHWWKPSEYTKLTSGVEADITSVFDKDNNHKANYTEIFTTLSEHGYAKPIINNYWRDNLAIGSEKLGGFKTSFNTSEEAGKQAEAFNELVRIIQPDGQIAFDTDGVMTLGKLTGGGDYKVTDFDVATLYNGDSLDAYLDGEGFADVEGDDFKAKSIGVVKPENSTYLLDGLVIPTYVGGADLESMYHVAKDVLFQGADSTGNLDETNLFTNFDFVCYTTPYQNLFDALKNGTKGMDEDYFEDVLGEYISIGMIEGSTIDDNHITRVVESPEDELKAHQAYNKALGL